MVLLIMRISILGSVVALCVAIVVGAISLIGENHRVDKLVDCYFKALISQDYTTACTLVGPSIYNSSGPYTCEQHAFLMELSLLKAFELLSDSDYEVESSRNAFWIPFLMEPEIAVNIKISGKITSEGDKSIMLDDEGYINDVFIARRENGQWKLVSLKSQRILSLYQKYKKEIDFSKYIEKVQDGIVIHNNIVNLSTISEEEGRLLRFSLSNVNLGLM